MAGIGQSSGLNRYEFVVRKDMKIKDRIPACCLSGFCIVAIAALTFVGLRALRALDNKPVAGRELERPDKMTVGTDGYVTVDINPVISNHLYKPGEPDRWGMTGSQDRYIDWPYPPLRTNLTHYTIIPNHGIAYIYYCNDGQLRWSFSPLKK